MVERQNGLCAICDEPLGLGRTEFDHEIPHAMRPGEKPSQAIHASCHRLKSKVDLPRIKKAIRLHRTFVLGEKRAKRKINSRGFDKGWRRRFDGVCERRTG